MERFDRYMRPLDCPLEQAPVIFQPVRVDVALNVALRMVNHLMDVFRAKARVGRQSIGEHLRTLFDVIADMGLKCPALGVVHHDGTDFTMALKQTHDYRLAGCSPALGLPLSRVHVPSLPADEGFIHFDFAAEFGGEATALHGKADAMLHEPCGLLSDAQGPVNFVAADAVFGIRLKPESNRPLVQTDRAVLHDRSDLDGKLPTLMLGLALPAPVVGVEPHVRTVAVRAAYNPVRPAGLDEKRQRRIGIGEVADGFNQSLWIGIFSIHAHIVGLCGHFVKYIITQIIAAAIKSSPDQRLMIDEIALRMIAAAKHGYEVDVEGFNRTSTRTKPHLKLTCYGQQFELRLEDHPHAS